MLPMHTMLLTCIYMPSLIKPAHTGDHTLLSGGADRRDAQAQYVYIYDMLSCNALTANCIIP